MTEIKRDVSISMSEASLKATLLVVPLAVLQIVPFSWLHAMQSLAFPTQTDITVFGFLLIFGILAHELIHLFTWMFFAQKPLKAFKLGFQWKSLTPYAHCKEPMDIRPYRIGFCPWISAWHPAVAGQPVYWGHVAHGFRLYVHNCCWRRLPHPVAHPQYQTKYPR
jgi:hypothetical protein